MPYDLIIFDCDGTLVDSEYLNNKACADALVRHGVTAYPLDTVLNHFGGMTMANISQIVKDEQGVQLPPEFVTDFVELARVYKKDMLAVAGALDAVDILNRSYKICVASNGERSLVKESLRMTGLNAWFGDDKMFTRIQVPQGKPAPDLFFFAAKEMGVDPAKCLVIEDSPTGVKGGVAAGMKVIGFTGATHDPAATGPLLSAAGAAVVLPSWPEILHYINGLTA